MLSVPSIAVNKLELNYVLNPSHPDFSRITREQSQDFFGIPILFSSPEPSDA